MAQRYQYHPRTASPCSGIESLLLRGLVATWFDDSRYNHAMLHGAPRLWIWDQYIFTNSNSMMITCIDDSNNHSLFFWMVKCHQSHPVETKTGIPNIFINNTSTLMSPFLTYFVTISSRTFTLYFVNSDVASHLVSKFSLVSRVAILACIGIMDIILCSCCTYVE